MSAGHAFLSASGAHRWLTCPPSAKLESQFPNTGSVYTAEGTFAHSLAELQLRNWLGTIKPGAYKTRLLKAQANAFYTPALQDAVTLYTDLIAERISEAQAACKDAKVFLERRVDFSEWVPGGYGTADVIIITDNGLDIYDLKFGVGVPINAEGNEQMRLYALGALAEFDYLYDLSNVRMTIAQPRLDSVSSDIVTADFLTEWAATFVAPKALQAMDGLGSFAPEEHACQFCLAKAVCRARAEAQLALAAYEFKKPDLLSTDEIADILHSVDPLMSWAKDIKDHALDQAVNHGINWPGWKLVEGRSNRKYSDETAVAQTLLAAGYLDETIYLKSLRTITAMEDTIGKKDFALHLSNLIIKPPGKPVLAPETDKRPAFNSMAAAIADFEGGIPE